MNEKTHIHTPRHSLSLTTSRIENRRGEGGSGGVVEESRECLSHVSCLSGHLAMPIRHLLHTQAEPSQISTHPHTHTPIYPHTQMYRYTDGQTHRHRQTDRQTYEHRERDTPGRTASGGRIAQHSTVQQWPLHCASPPVHPSIDLCVRVCAPSLLSPL